MIESKIVKFKKVAFITASIILIALAVSLILFWVGFWIYIAYATGEWSGIIFLLICWLCSFGLVIVEVINDLREDFRNGKW